MVFFQLQKWSSFGLILMKLGLPEKLGTLLYLLLCLVSLEELRRVGLLPQQGGRGRAAFQLDVGQHGLGAGAVRCVLNIVFVIFLGIFLRFTICPVLSFSYLL